MITSNYPQSWFTFEAAEKIRNEFYLLIGNRYRQARNSADTLELTDVRVVPSVREGGYIVAFVFEEGPALVAKEFCAANEIPFNEGDYERFY